MSKENFADKSLQINCAQHVQAEHYAELGKY